ncbi:MAG: c-type cytochrome biogenesis protein CcmI, partial [Casimicrobiaceae bacterium]
MTPVPLFWIFAFALVAITLAALLWPLLRRRPVLQAPASEEAAASIYRDQKRQLDADLAGGAISTQEHAAALDELVARLGAELPRDAAPRDEPPPRDSRAPWIAALVIVATLPAGALLGYFVLGFPAAMTPENAVAARGDITEGQMRAMVDSLAQKMKADPADPKGWVLLARSYAALGRFAEALDAYAQAAQRMPPDAQILADWADVAAMAQGRRLAGTPEALIARALAADPKNLKALALSATSKLERGDVAASLAQWRELRGLLPNGGEEAREIDTVIAQIEAQRLQPQAAAGVAGTAVAPAPATPAIAGAAVTGRVE